MQNYSKRFLNKTSLERNSGLIAFLFFTQLVACAPSSGGGSAAGEGLLCSGKPSFLVQPSQQNVEEEVETASLPKVTIDPKVDSYIVEFEDEENSAQGLQPSGNPIHEYQVSGLTLKGLNNGKTFTMKVSGSESDKQAAIQKLGEHRKIKFVEPDYPLYQVPETEADVQEALTTMTTSQWQHQKVQSNYAWQMTLGSQDIVVAIVDSGMDYTHNDLKDNVWSNTRETINGRDDDNNGYVDDIRGWNFVNGNNNPITTSSSNHGTHVAGIIGATNRSGNGIYGEAPRVKMMPLKFIGDNGSGSTSNAIRAIDYAVSKHVFAINNSWGSTARSQALESAIKRAEQAGILFIVAAGNGDSSGRGYDITRSGYYPAAFPESNIIRVAASTSSDTLTSFSNYGKSLVDVAAPGSSILSTVTGNRYMRMSGTSMATPLVTGLAVLVKAANPKLTFSQVKSIISSSVDQISSMKEKILSGGRVNARKAVTMAEGLATDSSSCMN